MEESKKPLVSILTPVFNANKSNYLITCIESILNQKYSNIEHVFADGLSTDGTLEILKEYSEKFPNRIKYVSGKDNGVGSALKKAYKKSRGEIIGWMDADDFYNEDAIETAISYFLKYQNASFIYGGCNIIDDDGKHIGNFIVSDFDKKIWLNVQHYLIFAAAFFKRKVIEDCGFVNDLGNDLFFYLNVAKKYKLYRVPEILSSWRLHSQSISLKRSEREDSIRKQRAYEDFKLVLNNGGSIFSPRSMTYLAVIQPSIVKRFKWLVPKKLKPLILKLVYQVQFSIARAEVNNNGGFAKPLANKILKIILLKK